MPSISLLPLTASHGLMHIMAIALPAVSPLVKEEFHLTNTLVGMLTFAFAAAIGVGSIPAGLLSDRVGSMMLIRLGFIATALLSALLPLPRTFFTLTIIFIVIGFVLSFYHPSALAYIARSCTINRGRTFGVHETGASIGLAITPLLAGIISLYYGWRFVYIFVAVPAVFLLLLLKVQKDGKIEVERMKESRNVNCNVLTSGTTLKGFLRQIMRTSSIRKIYLTEGLFGFVLGGALAFIPIFLNEAKGLGPEFAVAITSVFTVGGAIGTCRGPFN